MADFTINLNAKDAFTTGKSGTLYGRVHLGDQLMVAAREPETLERLAEAFMEAARDLRIAQLDEQDTRSLSAMPFLDSDNTAELMEQTKYRAEMRARAQAERAEEEMRAQESVDLALEEEYRAS